MARGCTCPAAVAAARIYRKRLRTGRLIPTLVPVCGTRRRLRAMFADGYPMVFLADQLGMSKSQLSSVVNDGGRASVRRELHNAVVALHARLSTRPGPSQSAARVGARRGWARSEHWVPDEMDDPAARSDLDYQRDDARRAPLLYEDIAWHDRYWPIAAVTDADRKMQTASRDERIATDLTRQLGWTVTVEAVQTCRRRGARSPGGKLTDAQIHTIRDRYVREVLTGRATRLDLCAAYGITQASLTHVLSGRTRPHLALPDLIPNSPQRRVTARDRARARVHDYSPTAHAS